MFERFTDRARRVLVLAQEEARLLNHGFIGTEHILLGLIHEEGGVAARALAELDVTLTDVRERVEEVVGLPGVAPTGSPPFTPRAKKVLELSLREALSLGHNFIGTEHLLLGVVQEGEGVAAQVLVSLGVELEEIRHQVIRLLGERGLVPETTAGLHTRPRRARRVESAAEAEGDVRARRASTRRRAQRCSFCGRDLWEVGRYVWARAVICEACVGLARTALMNPLEEQDGRAVPFPPRVFGAAPDDATVRAIADTVRAAFAFPALDRPMLDRLVVDADDELWSSVVSACRVVPLRPWASRLARIRFEGDRADILCSVRMDDGSTVLRSGEAIRRDGRWMLERETLAAFLRQIGVPVAPPAPPAPPGARPPPPETPDAPGPRPA